MVRNRGWIIHPQDLTDELIDTLAENGINELGIHPGGGKKAPELLKETLEFHKRPRTARLYEKAAEKGISVEYDAHVLSYLLPREHFGAHPDMFRADENGLRTPDINMCPSCAEALELVSENACRLAKALATPSHRYAYWLDDVTGGMCRCEKCRELSAADQALRVTNAIMRGLKAADSRAITGFLAYMDALAVPTQTRPEEGVYLEYAPIGRDSSKPMDDPASPENVREGACLKELISFFGVKNSRALEYWVDNSRFSNWTRPPKRMFADWEVMRRDVEFYTRLGFEDMTSFACFLGPDYIELYGEPPIAEYAAILAGK